MSATAKTKIKTTQGKSGSKKAGTSDKKAAANKLNSKNSTGPRTEEGKKNSKFNAVTHGLTARSALLPGDDPAELNALRCELLDGLQPRNSLESTLIVRIAEDKWISDRAEQAARRRVAERLRHEPLDQALKETDEALELAEHLFWNLALPLPYDGSSQSVLLGEPTRAGEAIHPSHPTRVRLRLERTVAGCDLLLGTWEALSQRLRVENAWLASDAFKMVRLMGMHAVDMEEDFDAARILMCSLTVIHSLDGTAIQQPANWPLLLIRMLASYDFEGREHCIDSLVSRCTSYMARLARLPLQRMAPESAGHARDWLTNVIDDEIKRLQIIRTTLAEIAAIDAAEAPIRFWFETGPEAENHRRYALSNKRVLNRSIGNFLLTRKQSEAGAFELVDVALGDRRPNGAIRIEESERDNDRARENGARSPWVEAPPTACADELLAATPHSEVICDDDQFLRNEPIPVEENAPKPPVADRQSSSPPVATRANDETDTDPKHQRGSLPLPAPAAPHSNPKRQRGSLSTAANVCASGSNTFADAIPHAAQTETLQRGEILTRSVSEEIGCGPSLALRVSVSTDRGEYSNAAASSSIAFASETNVDTAPTLPNGLKELSSSPGTPLALVVPTDSQQEKPCENLAASDEVALHVQRASNVESPAPSVEIKTSCGDDQSLRNEPNALIVRNSESHRIGNQPAQSPRVDDKKLSPEQLRILRLQRWQENKIREMKAAGWKEPFSTGIP